MGTQWYYKTKGEEFGPVSPSELKKLAHIGEISGDTPVRKSVHGHWVRAGRVKGLFDQPDSATQQGSARQSEIPARLSSSPFAATLTNDSASLSKMQCLQESQARTANSGCSKGQKKTRVYLAVGGAAALSVLCVVLGIVLWLASRAWRSDPQVVQVDYHILGIGDGNRAKEYRKPVLRIKSGWEKYPEPSVGIVLRLDDSADFDRLGAGPPLLSQTGLTR